MPSRRQILKESAVVAGLLASAGLLPQNAVAAFDAKHFEVHGFDETVKALGATSAPEESDQVILKGPDIAENGAVVPFGLESTAPNVKQIALLIEKNPDTLCAVFDVTPEVEPSFATRSKMQETSKVYAVALTTDGKALYAQKDVKVTLGGCGG